jgi:hypothetical protein
MERAERKAKLAVFSAIAELSAKCSEPPSATAVTDPQYMQARSSTETGVTDF